MSDQLGNMGIWILYNVSNEFCDEKRGTNKMIAGINVKGQCK